MAMVGTLIDLMTQDFDPSAYSDNYREAVLKIIEAKLAGRDIAESPVVPQGNIVDLMQALQASMDNIKAS
jgi:DNA end-binding protein Ku